MFAECRVGSGFCDELISVSVESKEVCVYVCVYMCVCVCVCLIVCSLETSTIRLPKPELDCFSPEKIASEFEVLQRTICVLYANFWISALI